jgi:two-component system sensor histidine kinase/response regulator
MMQVIDRTEALERVEGDVDLLRELVQIFLEDLPERVGEIRAALAARDTQILARAAHSLKGSAANISAIAVSDAARRLEKAAQESDLMNASTALRDLETEVEVLAKELSDFA